MRWRSITSATMLLALLNCALAPSTQPTTKQTARSLASVLVGTFHGTIVDDDETVPCVTTFRDYNGHPMGDYVVRAGTDEKYEGTLDQFKLVSAERRECRFRWTDKHGTGLLTLQFSPEARSFSGSWGLEVVQNELVWTGSRDVPSTQPQR